MMRVNSTCASGAHAMAVPGWPEPACWGASMARPRTTLIPSCSSSASVTTRTVPALRGAPTGGATRPAAGRSCAPGPGAGRTVARSVGRTVGRDGAGTGPQQRHRRGEAVDEVASPDRTELAGREEPRHGHRAQVFGQHAHVVVRLSEEPSPPAVAG